MAFASRKWRFGKHRSAKAGSEINNKNIFPTGGGLKKRLCDAGAINTSLIGLYLFLPSFGVSLQLPYNRKKINKQKRRRRRKQLKNKIVARSEEKVTE